MTEDPNPTGPSKRARRGLAWASLTLGVLICLGLPSGVANNNTQTSGPAETAGLVVGRLITNSGCDRGPRPS